MAQGSALGVLINAFSNSELYGFEHGIYAGVGLVVSLLLFTIFHHYSIFLLYELGMKIRVALTMLIYDKVIMKPITKRKQRSFRSTVYF